MYELTQGDRVRLPSERTGEVVTHPDSANPAFSVVRLDEPIKGRRVLRSLPNDSLRVLPPKNWEPPKWQRNPIRRSFFCQECQRSSELFSLVRNGINTDEPIDVLCEFGHHLRSVSTEEANHLAEDIKHTLGLREAEERDRPLNAGIARARTVFQDGLEKLTKSAVTAKEKQTMSGLHTAWMNAQREQPDAPLRLRLWKAGEAVPAHDFTEQEPGGKEISIRQFQEMVADLEPGGEIVLDSFTISVDRMGMIQVNSTSSGDRSPLMDMQGPLQPKPFGKTAGLRPRQPSLGEALLGQYRANDERHSL